MNLLEIKPFNLEATLFGGQSFDWEKTGEDEFIGFFTDKAVLIKKTEGKYFWQTYPKKNDKDFIKRYFNLDFEYEKMLERISKDKYVIASVKKFNGLRILKQDFNQTALNFILTSHKNMKAVKSIVRNLRKLYGEEIIIEEERFKLYPKIATLLKLKHEDFKKLGMGFRASYFVNVLNSLSRKEKTRNELLKIKGIGDKIADCIVVFAMNDFSRTPIDIWAMRVLKDFYNVEVKNYKGMSEWFYSYFKKDTAWAGQFLFEYIRKGYN